MAHNTHSGPNWIQIEVDSGSGDYTTTDAKHWSKIYLGSADKNSLLADGQSIVIAEVNPLESDSEKWPRKRLTITSGEREMKLIMRSAAKLMIDISQSTMADWTKALIILEL